MTIRTFPPSVTAVHRLLHSAAPSSHEPTARRPLNEGFLAALAAVPPGQRRQARERIAALAAPYTAEQAAEDLAGFRAEQHRAAAEELSSPDAAVGACRLPRLPQQADAVPAFAEPAPALVCLPCTGSGPT